MIILTAVSCSQELKSEFILQVLLSLCKPQSSIPAATTVLYICPLFSFLQLYSLLCAFPSIRNEFSIQKPPFHQRELLQVTADWPSLQHYFTDCTSHSQFPKSWAWPRSQTIEKDRRRGKQQGWDSKINHTWQFRVYRKGDSTDKNCKRKSSLE